MKSTVVIPNYNGIEYLRACLESLIKLQGNECEIIVVDNGSGDGSTSMVKECYGQVRLIALDTNTGFAKAVNVGIEASNTEYVILLNNDIEVTENFVVNLENAISDNEKIFSVSSKMIDMHNRDRLDGTGDMYCALGWAYACGKGKSVKDRYLSSKRVFSSCGGAAIYRKSVLDKIGLFDENHFAYLEDVDLGYRARINGYINVYEPSAVCYHAGSASSGSRYNEFKVNLSSRNSIYLICKNMPFLQFVLNLPFLLIGYMIKTLFFVLKGFGGVYIRGLGKGFALSFSKEGRSHHVRFRGKNLINYVVIQVELWCNMIRKLWA